MSAWPLSACFKQEDNKETRTMLQINMADVITILHSLVPYLVTVGVLLILALIITFAVNKKTVTNLGARKLVHSESWIIALVAVVATISMMLTGPMSTILNNASVEKHLLSSQTVASANKLANETQREAITLLKNDESNLPLSTKKINVFGWSSTNPVYGGSGSGSMSDQYPTVSMLEGMKRAGFSTNSKLSKFYTDFREKRPESGFKANWSLPETPVERYSQNLIDNCKEFSDQAVVVIARTGGEGSDLPTDMKAKNVIFNENSKKYAEFEAGQHYLQLDHSEKDLLNLVTKNFSKVTLIYNGANTFQFDFLDKYPQIKSVLWCPPAGQTGFQSLGDILAGKVNPSGRTSDTFIKDLKKAPNWNNFGDFTYDNADQFELKDAFSGEMVKPHFINYNEGIYVGYRFYETAAQEGLINYNDLVQYPFGYGLSYTHFEQKMSELNHANGKVSVNVTVTNKGQKPGKNVVELYYNPPYTNGGIEKASTNLVAFQKTKELKPGESQTVELSFDEGDMASYDAKGAKSYVLEKGDYKVSLQTDSHTVIDSRTLTIANTVAYNSKDKTHNGDRTPATNHFDNTRGDLTYLSRANRFANYTQASEKPASMSMSDEIKANFVNNGNYDSKKFDKASDKAPIMGAKNGIHLSDLYGKSYDDPLWDKLLDQLTFKDMDSLIAKGGYGTPAIKSIGKIQLVDADGPAALNNNFTKVGSIGFPSSTAFACTWNRNLAKRFGDMIAQMAKDMHITGWYAPAMNIHRSAFGGRNFEYFSEDPVLAGTLASAEVESAQTKGVYAFIKHFALNEQETNRTDMLCTWADEQSMREIYLKPFEMSVKKGGATAVMSSFNYIGPKYSGANPDLLQKVLRGEWGFRGFVVTDYFGAYDTFQNGDQEMRNGNDSMLATMDVTNHVANKSATSLKAMRQASHNILYTTANSWMYANGQPKSKTPFWRTTMYIIWGLTLVLALLAEFITIKRFMKRK